MFNKKKPPRTAAFAAVDCHGVVIRNNRSYGSHSSVSLINSPNSLVEGNVHYDESALTLFDTIESTIKESSSNLTREQSEKLLAELKEMRASYSSSSFKEKYASFMSSVSDHVTVLTALAPLIPSLAMMITGH